ncbi:MAG: tetratricopeptide repeat protein [Prevotellaceae bacterium]|nr:tetratricopeptide repeat protein [Candidatus Minthosoma caballi]
MMKKILFTAFLILVSVASFAISKVEADALYEKENYSEAAQAYESILQNEGVAAEVYYNLGNCYYKMDEMPRAILNYERALQLNPGDGDIRANLALARGKTVDKVVPPSEMFFVTWWRNMTNCMSLDSWSKIGISSFILLLCGLAMYMFLTKLTIRKIGFYGAMAMLVVTIIANLAALSQYLGFKYRNAAVVIAPSVTVKSSPSATSTDLFLIHEGSKVEILDSSMKEWIEVKFEEGKQGWVEVETVEVI